MRRYSPLLKQKARTLRSNMTDAEQRLWSRLRRKQIHGIQFYRQKPIEKYVVDFYAPAVALVVEVDGGQHFGDENLLRDRARTAALEATGLRVLRFDNLQVLQQTNDVVSEVERVVRERRNPP